jgi:two-component system cell cycle response regulator DivK
VTAAMKRIAIVEDNRDNRLLLRAIMDDRYELTEYATGRAALDGIRGDPPDLILLDISLPEMDGTEVLRRLRTDPAAARIPAIALTAHAMRGVRERLLAEGFDGYVVKPIVDEDELLSTIAQLLEAGSSHTSVPSSSVPSSGTPSGPPSGPSSATPPAGAPEGPKRPSAE